MASTMLTLAGRSALSTLAKATPWCLAFAAHLLLHRGSLGRLAWTLL